ncbi:hypothetical protein CHLNCDRAFT_133393 [Chlorella variabilis]|uniref:MYND-type domain-containing protein n=1 Tax=Chlorella variabilis TaxID=554065 RepID=E1Z304_CHLVA|nr:hypothetical protein CHLNCDRAFT_133393 [Chlorella variabilis]EFN59757.1 hypothetical protein CHLNCDRAFT_133393 [Chlorella variabilis]|eukprot:XP_005851859.1 hypothetical protein CHLNCDRAFT_133393 [Chlorella variabilis]
MAATTESAGIDCRRLMRGRLLKPERIQERATALHAPYNSCNHGGRFDYREIARVLGTRQLAQDKLVEVRNLISIFEHLAPALAYGGVHTSIVTLWNSSRKDWELRECVLSTLRLLLEACAVTPAGMSPFEGDTDSLEDVVCLFHAYLQRVVEEGMAARYAAGVDHCLEALFSCMRYRLSEAAAAAKEAMWEEGLPETLLRLALAPPAAYGAHGDAAEGEQDAGVAHFLGGVVNTMRVISCMCLADADTPTDIVLAHSELLGLEGAIPSLSAMMEVGYDLVYTPKYEAYCGREGCQAAGGGLLRNCFAAIGYGMLMVPEEVVQKLRDAGKPAPRPPRRIKEDRGYRGHYKRFFRCMASRLLALQGTASEQVEELAKELLEEVVQLSAPQILYDGPTGSQPREPSYQMSAEVRRPMSQAVTPGGEPVTLSEVTLSTRDYSKACAHCKKEAAQVAAEAAAAAGGGQQGAEAAGQAKLRACSGCHRAQYCSKTCQTLDWPNHKAECKRYRRQQA